MTPENLVEPRKIGSGGSPQSKSWSTYKKCLTLSGIVVFGPVLHDELVVHEVERVALRLPWTSHHRFAQLRRQLGHRIHHLPSVRGVWHRKRHLEVERLDDHISEVVPLDHAEALHRVGSDVEGQLSAHSLDIQEVRAEVVRDGPASVVAVLIEDADVLRSLGYLEENLSVVKIPDPEADEVHLIYVGGVWAEEHISRLR